MADYSKTNWIGGTTPLSPGNMNKIEKGIYDLSLQQKIQTPTTGSTSNSIVLTTGSDFTYSQGNPLRFKALVDSDTNNDVSVNADGKGTKPLLKPDGTRPTLKANRVYDMYYDTASGGRFFLLSRATGNTIAAHVLEGDKCSTEDGEIIGTMPNRAGVNQVATGVASNCTQLHFTVPNGSYDGATNVYAVDENYTAANIKEGKTIFGLAGSMLDIQLVAGNTLTLYSATSSASTPSSAARVLGVSLDFDGTARLGWGCYNNKCDQASTYVQVYKNGSPWSTIGSYINYVGGSYTQDITVQKGDVYEVYIWQTGVMSWWSTGSLSVKVDVTRVNTVCTQTYHN